DGNVRELSVEEAWETIENFAQGQKEWDLTITILDQTIANLKTQLVKNEVVRVMIPKCMAWLDDEPLRDLNTIKDKVDNPIPQIPHKSHHHLRKPHRLANPADIFTLVTEHTCQSKSTEEDTIRSYGRTNFKGIRGESSN
ncbi:hypothetical protein Tco_0550214, partial [Tanacetum coccineum]